MERSVSESDISRVAQALKGERLEQTVTPVLKDGMAKWGERVLSKLNSDVKFDLRNPLIGDYLDAWREQSIVSITRTARDQVTSLLQQGVKEGVGIDELKRRLREKFEGWSDTKAQTIARTEVVGASNSANLAAYQISGLVDSKEWLAVQGDDATRETHEQLDGQTVGIGDQFTSDSGATTQGPGLFGIAAEDINCRCTVLPKMNDLASPAGEERAMAWKGFVAQLQPFEDDTRDAVAKVIGMWLGDAVQALG